MEKVTMIQEIYCTINDENIYGEMILPNDFEGKLPTVILSHGLTASHNRMKECAMLLKNYGIAAYIFDFRGGSEITISDGETEDMTVYSEVDDLNAVIDMVKTLDYVDNDRLYLLGHSQGGLVSALVANNRVEEISGLFLIAPAFIIPEISEYLSGFSNINSIYDVNLGDWWFTTGKRILSDKYLEVGKSINLFDDVNGFNKKVLIFHGFDDSIVPLSYSIKANKAYDDAELMVLNNESHLFSFNGERLIIRKVYNFISKKKKF